MGGMFWNVSDYYKPRLWLNSFFTIYVVEASKLCGIPSNNEIPICLAYDQVHYEALVPDTNEDIIETIALKKSIVNGTYQFTVSLRCNTSTLAAVNADACSDINSKRRAEQTKCILMVQKLVWFSIKIESYTTN